MTVIVPLVFITWLIAVLIVTVEHHKSGHFNKLRLFSTILLTVILLYGIYESVFVYHLY